MRVLLVKPCWAFPIGRAESTYNRIWPPLSLANCAALLRRAGHQPEILDAAGQAHLIAYVERLSLAEREAFLRDAAAQPWE